MQSVLHIFLQLVSIYSISSDAIWTCNRKLSKHAYYECERQWKAHLRGMLVNMEEHPVQRSIESLNYGIERNLTNDAFEIGFEKLGRVIKDTTLLHPMRPEGRKFQVDGKTALAVYQNKKSCESFWCYRLVGQDGTRYNYTAITCSSVTVHSGTYTESAYLGNDSCLDFLEQVDFSSLAYLTYLDSNFSNHETLLENGTTLFSKQFLEGVTFLRDKDAERARLTSESIALASSDGLKNDTDLQMLLTWLNSQLHDQWLNASRQTGFHWGKYNVTRFGLRRSSLNYQISPGQQERVYQAMAHCGGPRVHGPTFPVLYENNYRVCWSPDYQPACVIAGHDLRPGSPFSLLSQSRKCAYHYRRIFRGNGLTKIEITHGLKGPGADKVGELSKTNFLSKMQALKVRNKIDGDWTQLWDNVNWSPYGGRIMIRLPPSPPSGNVLVLQMVGSCAPYSLATKYVLIAEFDGQDQCINVTGELGLDCEQISSAAFENKIVDVI